MTLGQVEKATNYAVGRPCKRVFGILKLLKWHLGEVEISKFLDQFFCFLDGQKSDLVKIDEGSN
jgi:hypothetical protein